jgi:pimeloyl-ACP methyl ester carboxylesterase
MFLPGGVMPAGLTYDKVLAELAGAARPILHDLQIYRGDAPPADYTIDTEVDAIDQAADEAGVDRFHLIGYSAGADFSLAYAAAHGARLRSLTLIEPDWLGNDAGPQGSLGGDSRWSERLPFRHSKNG